MCYPCLVFKPNPAQAGKKKAKSNVMMNSLITAPQSGGEPKAPAGSGI